MLCPRQGAVFKGCLQGRSLRAAQVCGGGLRGLPCLLQLQWGPSKARKIAGPCRGAACMKAANDSRAAAESVGEGVGRPQPPSRRGRPSCISAVRVAKGPAMSAPACWFTWAASLTEMSMLPASGSTTVHVAPGQDSAREVLKPCGSRLTGNPVARDGYLASGGFWVMTSQKGFQGSSFVIDVSVLAADQGAVCEIGVEHSGPASHKLVAASKMRSNSSYMVALEGPLQGRKAVLPSCARAPD
jgi:hypothetical protein